jgi:uncharacterized protein (DUF2147 family)
MKKLILFAGLPAIVLSLLSFAVIRFADADGDKLIGTWLNQEGTSHIQIVKLETGAFAGKYYGKIVWLKVTEEDGKPRTDKNNPDASKRSAPLMGLIILKDFKYDASDKEWESGTIYDPKNGKTYSCKITMKDNNTIDVRGYVGISLIGRTTAWTRVK